MKTTMTLLLSALWVLSFPTTGRAQSWTLQGADITGSSLFIGDISAVSDDVAWAIASSFEGGWCGLPVRKYTRTVDGGATWESGSIPGASPYTIWNICAIDENTAWVSSFHWWDLSAGRVLKTTDGGATWVQQTTATFTSACQFVHFFNANEGVAVGTNEVFTTTDGGANWIEQDELPVPWDIATFFLINSYEVVGDHIWLGDNYGMMYHSADRGLTWDLRYQPGSGLHGQNIKGVAFRDDQHGMVVCSTFSGGGNGGGASSDNAIIRRTSDGGQTWEAVPISSPTQELTWQFYAKYDIGFVKGSEDTWIMTSEYNGFNKFSAISTDGGDTWNYIDNDVAHTALSFAPDGAGWSGGYITSANNGIYKFDSGTASVYADYQQQLNEQLTIRYNGAEVIFVNQLEEQQVSSLRLLASNGRLVAVLPAVDQPRMVLPVESLAPGVYFLQVTVGNAVVNKKVLVGR